MKTKSLSNICSILILISLTLGLTACSSAKASEDTGVITVNVGTTGTYNPFSIVDENGVLTGYDIEVLREVEKIDSSLKFNFITSTGDSMFLGLDSDRYQLLANQYAWSEERDAKYHISKVGYFVAEDRIIVKKGRTDIKTWDDLVGKVVGVSIGSYFTKMVEDWDNEHGNVLTLKYYETDSAVLLQEIASGRIDAIIDDPIYAHDTAELLGIDVEPVGEILASEPSFFIAKKDATGEIIRDKIDTALQKLHNNGKLTELSLEWFGVDYSK